MSELKLSVIICTHNPREDFLQRTLDSIKKQDLPTSDFELLVIDNASKDPLSQRLNLSWHPFARVVRENQLGLTPARMRGIKEANSPILLFIDDDNVLATDYLSTGLRIEKENNLLGAWGGRLDGEYEAEVPEKYKDYLWMLAVIEQDKDYWSNVYGVDACVPTGAGMFLKKDAALDYLHKVQGDPLRLSLDRKGNSLSSCGDIDMARCALDVGYGIGTFLDLKFTHLIPKSRLQEEYLVKLASANAYSKPLVDNLRKETRGIIPRWDGTPMLIRAKRKIKKWLALESFEEKIKNAQEEGLKKAWKVIKQMDRELQKV